MAVRRSDTRNFLKTCVASQSTATDLRRVGSEKSLPLVGYNVTNNSLNFCQFLQNTVYSREKITIFVERLEPIFPKVGLT